MTHPLIEAAAAYFRIAPSDILGKRRSQRMVKARAAVSIVMRHRDAVSLPQIGKRLGGRDHSTVINCIDHGWRWMVKDPTFGPFVDAQLCLPRFSAIAAHVESPFPAPFTMRPPKPRDRHLGPVPAHLVMLKPVEPPRERIMAGSKSFSLTHEGFSNEDLDWRKGLVRASKSLIAAMVREHPERFAA